MKKFSSQLQFLTEIEVTTLVTYEQFAALDNYVSSPLIIGDVEFVSHNPESPGFAIAKPGGNVERDIGPFLDGCILTQSRNEQFDIHLPSGIEAVGFYVFTNGQPLQIQFMNEAGIVLAVEFFPAQPSMHRFVGIRANEPVRTITWRATGGASKDTCIGPLMLGNALSPIEDIVVMGRIAERYHELGGAFGPLGRATGPEVDADDGPAGKVQMFEHGVIGFSPTTGERSTVVLYQRGADLVYEWGPTSPFNYDAFDVSCYFYGEQLGEQLTADSRTSGKWIRQFSRGGVYRLAFQGVDKHMVGEDIHHQGFSFGLRLDYRPLGPDYQRRKPQLRRPVRFCLAPGSDASLLAKSVPPDVVQKLRSLIDRNQTFLSQGRFIEALVTLLSSEELNRYRTQLLDTAVQLGEATSGPAQLPPSDSVVRTLAQSDDYAANAILYFLQKPSMGNHEIWSRLAFSDFFEFDGEKYRDEARQHLLGLQPFGTGTHDGDGVKGDYDVDLMPLLNIAYGYFDDLRDLNVQDHLVNTLLNTYGPVSESDLREDVRLLLVDLDIPETENHLLLIEVARYLTNQLRYRREGLPEFDNTQNGVEEWLLNHLRQFLENDFVEYNSRPYQDNILYGLLTLYNFSTAESRIKVAAGLVLDYVMAKMASSSNEGRRLAPYRRRVSHLGASMTHLLPTPPEMSEGPPAPDPMFAWLTFFAGTNAAVWQDQASVDHPDGLLPDNYAVCLLFGGLSEYRLPEPILDLMVNRQHAVFIQRFRHTIQEVYASSPSYLISAGGQTSENPYKLKGAITPVGTVDLDAALLSYTVLDPGSFIVTLGIKIIKDIIETTNKEAQDNKGVALPTTFLPTGQFTSALDLIRFEGEEAESRVNFGVARDFACGTNLSIPSSYDLVKTMDWEHWIFIDQSTEESRRMVVGGALPYTNELGRGTYPSPSKAGYYLAIYHDVEDGKPYGFFEAYDTAVPQNNLSFDEFKERVYETYIATGSRFSLRGPHDYTMTDGRKIEFEFYPISYVKRSDVARLADGDILRSGSAADPNAEATITISNPAMETTIELDFRNWDAPHRIPPRELARNPLEFREPIVSGGIAALGGWVKVAIYPNGVVSWEGDATNSGFDSYEFSVSAVVRARSGRTIALNHSGSIPNLIAGPTIHRPWTNRLPANAVIAEHFDDFIGAEFAVVLHYKSGIAEAFEQGLTWLIGNALGTALGPVGGLVIFVGVEIGSLVSTGSLDSGARIVGEVLWLAGPGQMLFALAAEGIATLGSRTKVISQDFYDWANQSVFSGSLPPREILLLTDTIGGGDRAFTFPRYDGKITLNMGPAAYDDPRNYPKGKFGEVFIHELVHACQIHNQSFNAAFLADAFASKVCEATGGQPYEYDLDDSDFRAFNLEQQAQIVSDWYARNVNVEEARLNNFSSLQTEAAMSDAAFKYIAGNVRTRDF